MQFYRCFQAIIGVSSDNHRMDVLSVPPFAGQHGDALEGVPRPQGASAKLGDT